MITATQLQTTARTYLDTPFHDKARIKGKGMDCVGLVLSVGEDLGIVDVDGRPFKRSDYPYYSAQPMGHFVHEECLRRLIRKGPADIKPGAIVTMRLPQFPCHVGIVTDMGRGRFGLIHAYSGGAAKVVEHILDMQWKRRIVGVFYYPGE
jgi:cell wall-associated NlpC family hydrolase